MPLAMCGVAMLAIAGTAIAARSPFDGHYIGKRVLTKGPAEACTAEENVSVTIHGGVLTFTNSGLQNYAVAFEPEPDGTFSDTYVDSDGATVEIHGRIAGSILNADVSNAPCEHHWRLQKK